jgi:molybdopterin-guanine dinucleotide biosynthesis protein A
MSNPAEAFDAVVLAGGRAARLGGVDKPALRVGEHSLLGSVVGAAAGAGARLVVVVGPARQELAAELGELRTVREDPPGGGPVPALRRGLAELDSPEPPPTVLESPEPRPTVLESPEPPPTVLESPEPRPTVLESPEPRPRVLESPEPHPRVLESPEPRPTAAGSPWVAVLAADLPFLRAGHLLSLLASARKAGVAGAVLADDAGHPQWLVGCWRTPVLREAIAGYRGGSLRGLLRPLRPAVLAPPHDRGEPPPWLDCDTADDVRTARRLV